MLHGDNGSTLKATTVLAMLNWLGINPSYSRPRVSDDNPYAESLFRTAKYRPEFPASGFEDLEAARDLGRRLRALVQLRPQAQRHSLCQPRTSAIPEPIRPSSRLAMPCTSKLANVSPARWSRNTRNWSPIGAVTLNPERDAVVSEHQRWTQTQPKAA